MLVINQVVEGSVEKLDNHGCVSGWIIKQGMRDSNDELLGERKNGKVCVVLGVVQVDVVLQGMEW